MKKFLSILLIIFAVCLASTASAYDFEVNEGDQIRWVDGQAGMGGEFTWIQTNSHFSWKSFCVETSEGISPNTPYTVSGISSTTTSRAALTNEVAWLYWSFNNNGLDGYDSNDSLDQMALQNLIWRGMGQSEAYFYYGLNRDQRNSVNDKMAEFWSLAVAANWTNDGRVQVINLLGAQDQLIAANPVPEPASMFLLGTGLIGLAAMGRKKLQIQTKA